MIELSYCQFPPELAPRPFPAATPCPVPPGGGWEGSRHGWISRPSTRTPLPASCRQACTASCRQACTAAKKPPVRRAPLVDLGHPDPGLRGDPRRGAVVVAERDGNYRD